MKAARYNANKSGTSSKTTLPLRLTNQTSANTGFPRLYFHHHYLHRLHSGALEFVNDIIDLLEQTGGLAVCARQF